MSEKRLIAITEEQATEEAAWLVDAYEVGITQHEARAAVGWSTLGTRAADDFEATGRFKDKIEIAWPPESASR